MVAIQSARSSSTTLNSYGAYPKQRSQFFSSIASAPRTPAAPEILDATHVMSSSEKSRSTVSGISLYYSKAVHVGFSTEGTRMSGCFSRRKPATGRPIFMQKYPRRRHPLPHGPWPDRPPAADFLTERCFGSCAPGVPHPLLCPSLGQCIPHQACVDTPLPEV